MRKNIGLYKAKRKDNGKWVYGFYIGDIGDGCHEICDINDITGHRVEVEPETVCECSGTTDKNEQLIYEGDMLKYTDSFDHTHIGFVVWSVGCFSLQSMISRNCPAIDIILAKFDIEIVGNIHDMAEAASRCLSDSTDIV